MASRFIRALRALFDPTENDQEAPYRRRLLAEYRSQRPRYEEFGLAMHKLLDSFLTDRGYTCQVTYRTKTPERLREKLIRKAAHGTRYAELSDIEDLAGLRVIFYSEADKKQFIKDIKKESMGIIRIEEKEREKGYEATHIIMGFGAKRLKLSEYKHFEGLKCEIQVTTILRHAWAEIQHDLVYKDVLGLKEKNPERHDVIKRKLEAILEKYIKQASVEFEEVIEQAIDSAH